MLIHFTERIQREERSWRMGELGKAIGAQIQSNKLNLKFSKLYAVANARLFKNIFLSFLDIFFTLHYNI
jgi:hypothetical protein